MKPIKHIRFSFFLFILFFLTQPQLWADTSQIEFWNSQRRGANLFNNRESPERLKAAKNFGIEVIRLAPNKWLNGRTEKERGDFLIGKPGTFHSINTSDVKYLRHILDEADQAGLKVVLTMLSLPGARWKQHNNGIEERKIWEDFSQQNAALSFWKQLAQALKGHPALVGYNIRNEPSPELVRPQLNDWYSGDYEHWYKKVRGTPADINLFYQKAVKAIREIDLDVPIILDSGYYATAWGFKILEPVSDNKVLYSFHMYEPYSFNSRFNQKKYKYPGNAPIGELKDAPILFWNKAQFVEFLSPVIEWQKKYKIPSNRIFVGEVGVVRTNEGAQDYLKDLLEIFNTQNWHWAFYSFREDTWPGMDYELGTSKPPFKYWEAIQKGHMPGPEVYKANSLSSLLRAFLIRSL